MSQTRQQEFDNKIAAIRAWLAKDQYAAVAITSQQLFSWATAGGENYVVMGNDHGVATLLIGRQTITVLANNIEIPRLCNEEFKGIDLSQIEFWQGKWYSMQLADEIHRRMDGSPFATDSSVLGGAPVNEGFNSLTYTLQEGEIARYRKLGKDCSAAMEEALAKVRPGMTEYEVAALICARMWDHSVRPHLALVASDERCFQFRHPIPTGKKVKKHIMAVLCGKRGGLIINLTRMLHFARKLPDELQQKHAAVCAVDVALNTATTPGVAMKDIFAAGMAKYEAEGFGQEWKLHHQGGRTGYQGRSYLGTPTEQRVALVNQAFAWNPSIAGTKSEDTILVGEKGFEFLSGPTKAWPTITVKANGKSYKRAGIKLR